jgi:streptogramin lyase
MAKNLWLFNALSAPEESSGGVFYLTTFNSAGLGQLIRLDTSSNQAKSWTIPVGIGSWDIIRGRDGNLYLGSYNGGTLMCFDPRKERWIAVAQMSEGYRKKEFIIASLVQTPNNNIYYGTYPGCRLVRCDLDKGVIEDVGSPAPEENYLRGLETTAAGVVLCSVATQRARTVAYMPKTKSFKTLTPEEFQRPGFSPPVVTANYIAEAMAGKIITYNARTLNLSRVYDSPDETSSFVPYKDDQVLYQQGREGLYLFDLRNGKKSEFRRTPLPPSTARTYLTKAKEALYLRVQSYTVIGPRTSSYEWKRIPVDGLGQGIFWLNTFSDGRIFGGPELGQTMFAWDPKSGRLDSYDQVVEFSGEIYYAIPYRGKLYTISYIKAILAVYDPARPWNQGTGKDSNPRTILHIPDSQYRPVGGIHLGPGGKMYIGTQPNYGMLGGALSVFDPETESVEVHRHIIPDQQITAVATDAKWVYAASSPGGGGGAKAKGRTGHFFVWDPAAKKIVYDLELEPGRGISAMTSVNGCVYFLMGRAFSEYNHATGKLRTVVELEKPARIPNQSLRACQDGTLWAILSGQLARIDPRENRIDFLKETAGHAQDGLTVGADGTIYFGAGTDMWIHKPERPSPLATLPT